MAYNGSIPPLTMQDFLQYERGTLVILHTYRHNRSAFIWHHRGVEQGPDGMRVVGSILESGESLASSAGYEAELYEFGGAVCCGSSADPVFDEAPDEPVGDDWGEPADAGEEW